MSLFSLLNFFSFGQPISREEKMKNIRLRRREKKSAKRGPKPEPDDNYYDNFVDGRGF